MDSSGRYCSADQGPSVAPGFVRSLYAKIMLAQTNTAIRVEYDRPHSPCPVPVAFDLSDHSVR